MKHFLVTKMDEPAVGFVVLAGNAREAELIGKRRWTKRDGYNGPVDVHRLSSFYSNCGIRRGRE